MNQFYPKQYALRSLAFSETDDATIYPLPYLRNIIAMSTYLFEI